MTNNPSTPARPDMRSTTAQGSVSAGSLCLDFLAALEHWSDPRDGTPTRTDELGAWLTTAGLPSPVGGLTAEDAADAGSLRVAVEAIARAIVGGAAPASDHVRCLNRFAMRPTPVFLLGASGRRRVPVEQVDAWGSLAVVARDAVHLFGELPGTRLRACAREGCDTLFYDRSASGVRRWCAMKGCGEIVAAASYRRRRATRPAVSAAPLSDPLPVGVAPR